MPTTVLDDAAALTHEQVRAHLALVRTGVAGSIAIALSLAFVQWDVVDHGLIAGWLGCFVPVHLMRLQLGRLHQAAPGRATDPVWRRRFLAVFTAHGAVWGLASLLLFPDGDLAHQSFLALTLAGTSASFITLTAFDLAAGLLFMGFAMVPLAGRLLYEGGHIHLTTAFMLALFVTYMAVNARQAHLAVVESVRVRRAAAGRAEALARFQSALTRLRGPRAGGDTFFSAATSETAAALDIARAVLWLCDTDAGGALIARAQSAAGPDATPAHDLPPLRFSAHPRYAARLGHGSALMYDAARQEAAFEALAGTPFLPAGTQARLDVPLSVGGRLEGVLWCEHHRPHRWTDDEETFVTAVAATVLSSIEEGHRRRAEQRLRELNQHLEQLVSDRTRALTLSEARLAEALDASNDGLWEFELATGVVYFSPVWARLLGYAPGEVPARVEFFWQTVHPDDAARVQSVITDHLEGRRPSKELEVRLRTKSGEYRWFLDRGRVVERDAGGAPTRMVGTISDITDQKRAALELRASEERFRAVFDKTPVIVALVRMEDGRIAEVNEAGLRAFGLTREEMVGQTTTALNLWVDEVERRRAAGMLIHQGLVSGFEMQLRRKGGEHFWALLSSSQISLHGEPYSLNTLQDVTERRELQARFIQSQKMDVVGHLAGGIAHDFNNVLTVITGTAELALVGASPDDPIHEALATIRDASGRAASLTAQLMAFSRRQILQPVALDLNEVVAGLEAMLGQAVGATVALAVVPARGPATVVADRGNVEQVILNLAINARDAMPAGGTLTIVLDLATIDGGRVAVRGSLQPGRYVTITVSDTGSGMSDAVVQRIFEPFYTTKAVGKGTGLGLSMAHGAVAQSGGDIVVRSVVGVGSSFTVYLPWSETVAQAATASARGMTAGKGTILVVDDTREIREVVRRVLSFAGYQVLTAEHGDDALRVLHDHDGRVDLLLTDVVMPGLTGRELANRVHAGYPAVRVLFTSGYANDAIARHGVLAEGVQFIAKPYSLQALARKVREVLDAPA